jgi:hypothetical protein
MDFTVAEVDGQGNSLNRLWTDHLVEELTSAGLRHHGERDPPHQHLHEAKPAMTGMCINSDFDGNGGHSSDIEDDLNANRIWSVTAGCTD